MMARKELAVGNDRETAIARFPDFDEEKHEVVFDPVCSLWQIFRKRKPNDRSIKHPITRVARAPYSNGYGKDLRPVVVTLLPRELIETRLKGTRRRYSISWDDLHAYLVRRAALGAMAARREARKKRKALRKRRR